MCSVNVWQVVLAGYLQRIDLSAHGFYITPDIGFEWDVGKGKPFAYYTFGAAFAETEIDTLTGDFYLRRVDIVMDLGHSLNPGIDIGQVSAFQALHCIKYNFKLQTIDLSEDTEFVWLHENFVKH
jgi:xanthine dehydrogenase molybdopterin-binding subunit B